jgi:cytochrome P450/NAD(P)-dependent dehydrogenase (short-subunit alcohol dehydrogenase family)
MKTVLITGGGSVIGLNAVKRFSQEGWNVIATARKAENKELLSLPNVAVYELDLEKQDTITKCLNAVLAKFKSIDVLVNNAGYVLSGPFEACSMEQVRRQMEVNFFGVLAVTKQLLPSFRRAKSGVIINVSSLCGLVTFPALSVYHASKWALEGFTESLQFELAPLGIKAKLVEPGGVRSNSSTVEFAAEKISDYGDLIDRLHKTKWFPSFSEPSLIADVIYGAATDASGRLRYRVGKDADLLYTERLENLDGEAYLARIRQRILPQGRNGPSAEVNLTSYEFSQNPYRVYDQLRAEGPVHFLQSANTWLVIGFREAVAVLGNPQAFSSTINSSFDPVLIGCDPPDHAQHRKALEGPTGPFSRDYLGSLVGKHREFCRQLLREVAPRGSFDVLADYAMPLSSMVILDLLGLAADRTEELRNWTLTAVSTRSVSDQDFAEKQWLQFKPRVEQWVDEGFQKPQPGALAHILRHSDLGKKLSRENIIDLTKILLVGGNETTPNLVAGALLIMIRNPELLGNVRRDLSMIPRVIHETLRLESPTQIVHRTCRADCVIGNTKIPANATVKIAVGAANRDPAEFEKPDEFILDRANSKNVAFGYGPHYCIGAQLAKQEATIALEELVSRFPLLSLEGPFTPVYRHCSHVRALTSLRVRIGT